jgi:hypothetical protein
VVMKNIELPSNVTVLPSLDDTIQYIENVKTTPLQRAIMNSQN